MRLITKHVRAFVDPVFTLIAEAFRKSELFQIIVGFSLFFSIALVCLWISYDLYIMTRVGYQDIAELRDIVKVPIMGHVSGLSLVAYFYASTGFIFLKKGGGRPHHTRNFTILLIFPPIVGAIFLMVLSSQVTSQGYVRCNPLETRPLTRDFGRDYDACVAAGYSKFPWWEVSEPSADPQLPASPSSQPIRPSSGAQP